VPSDQDIPFNEKPAMKCREITDLGKQALRSGKYDGGQVRLNFPNAGARARALSGAPLVARGPPRRGLPCPARRHGGAHGRPGGDGRGVHGRRRVRKGAARDPAWRGAACARARGCAAGGLTRAPPPAQELLDEVAAVGGRWLVTADHGNAEDMVRAARTVPPSAPPALACPRARGARREPGPYSTRARPARCAGAAGQEDGRAAARGRRAAAAAVVAHPQPGARPPGPGRGRPCGPPRGAAHRPRGRAQVPVAIGGPGLPDGVRFCADLPHAGLANVGPTILNLLGFEAPPHMVPTLLA